MGRPRKKGLDYFPFDVDFFTDEKVVCIAGEFGLKGEIAMIKLLCAVYRNGYFLEWNDMVKMKMLHNMPGISAELLDQIIARLVRWGFFCRSLFDTAKVLTSEGIQRRYFEATKFRIPDNDPPYLLIDKFKNYGVSQTETTVSKEENGISQTESPLKEIKGKRSINIDPKVKGFWEYYLAPERKEFRDTCQRKYGILNLETAFVEFYDMLVKLDLLDTMNTRKDFERLFQNKYCIKRSSTKPPQQPSYGTQQQDRLSRRRGIDPSTHRAEDYTPTL